MPSDGTGCPAFHTVLSLLRNHHFTVVHPTKLGTSQRGRSSRRWFSLPPSASYVVDLLQEDSSAFRSDFWISTRSSGTHSDCWHRCVDAVQRHPGLLGKKPPMDNGQTQRPNVLKFR